MNIFKEKQSNCDTYKFIAKDGDKEIGHAFLHIIHNDCEDVYYGLLADVKVDEEFRSQGIGTKLVLDVIKEAKKLKCKWIVGTSRYARTRVHKWYERLGFRDYGKEFRIDY